MKKTEITKQKIISATTELLRKNGAATVKDISEAASVNIASINYHFHDKDNLIIIVCQKLISNFVEQVSILLDCTANSIVEIEDYIKSFINMLYDFVFQNVEIFKFAFAPQNSEILLKVREYFQKTFSLSGVVSKKIFQKLAQVGKMDDPSELKVKYLMLFSCMAMPFITHFKALDNEQSTKNFPILTDDKIKEIYVKQLVNIVMN